MSRMSNIDTDRLNESLGNFMSQLEKPAREGVHRLVDTGIDALRSRIKQRRQRRLTPLRTLVGLAALGAVGVIVLRALNDRGVIGSR